MYLNQVRNNNNITISLMTTMKKSMNRAELLEFPSFLSISHAENMSACLRENLGFFKFFTETESLKQKRALLENITPIVI